jgi:hypothetical protein
MQTVDYRKGLLRFDIPESWRCELDRTGGIVAYEDRPGSGTLRVSLATFSSESDVGLDAASIVLHDGAADAHVEVIGPGLLVRSRVEEAQEDGQVLQARHWELGQALPPKHLRVVVFTYTSLPGDEESVQWLEESVRNARLATGLTEHEGPSRAN